MSIFVKGRLEFKHVLMGIFATVAVILGWYIFFATLNNSLKRVDGPISHFTGAYGEVSEEVLVGSDQVSQIILDTK